MSPVSSFSMTSTVHWEELAATKRKARQDAIPQAWLISSTEKGKVDVTDIPAICGILTPKEVEITETSDVCVLLAKLASGEWSSVEVTTAFCKRAVIAQQLVNCLTEIFIEKALERAAQLDDHLKRTGTVMGPLHGLPVSLKDQFSIKGMDTTMGYTSWIGKVADDDAVLVKALLKAGAVLYVRTNVPQTLMWGETHNNIFGRTVNPLNTNLTPGGSSGGEAALIALRGSVVGAGTDVGGSIRNPAHFCGLYGFKPSSHRLPAYGLVNSLDGQDTISLSVGPLAASLSGLKIFVKAILDQSPWREDPFAIRKHWDQAAYQLREHGDGRQLCFGILWDDEIFKPHPPIIRALRMVKDALERAGHKVVDWVPFKHAEICANARSIFLSDGGADYKAALTSGEPMINSMKPGADPDDIPPFRRPRDPLNAFQLWQLNKERRDLRKAYLDRWEATVSLTGTGRPVDAVICPVSPYAAVPHGEKRGAVYTIAWNTLDCPSLVVPVTKVDPELDPKAAPHQFRSDDDRAIYELYDPEVFKGMPVGIQIVGQTQEEEAVLAIGEIVDRVIRAHV